MDDTKHVVFCVLCKRGFEVHESVLIEMLAEILETEATGKKPNKINLTPYHKCIKLN
jgi:hypothetical protein